MFDDFANPETQVLAFIGIFVVVSLVVVGGIALRAILRTRQQERARDEACSEVQLLATQLSFADIVVSDQDCAEQYKLSLAKCRAQFKDCVEAMNSWLQRKVHDEQQWRSLGTTARVTREVVLTNASYAQEFLRRCRHAKTALKAAVELVSLYAPPEGLTVELQPAIRQVDVARRMIGDHRFEDAQRICMHVEELLEACEEAARLFIVADEVRTKCGEDSWQAERARTTMTNMQWMLDTLDAPSAAEARDRFKLTRTKLMDYSNEPEPGTLLEDEA